MVKSKHFTGKLTALILSIIGILFGLGAASLSMRNSSSIHTVSQSPSETTLQTLQTSQNFDPDDQHQIRESGQYVVWVEYQNGLGQIHRLDQSSGEELQITWIGNNQYPQVNQLGQIAWQRWENESWQAYVYDGRNARKKSTSSTVRNVELNNTTLTFEEKDQNNLWQRKTLSITE